MEFMHHDHWKDALFLHYEADPFKLQALLPPDLVVDTYKGKAYVGIVALSEIGISPKFWFVPTWLGRLLGQSHDAVNVRTYVKPKQGGDGKPGIYFFTLDCSKWLPALGARLLFYLPYRWATMSRNLLQSSNESSMHYNFTSSRRFFSNANLEVEWKTENQEDTAIPAPNNSLAYFFVERYCLYNRTGMFLKLLLGLSNQLWCGSITHNPWPVQSASVTKLYNNSVLYAVPGMQQAVFANQNPIAHFSPGVSDISFFLERMPNKKKEH